MIQKNRDFKGKWKVFSRITHVNEFVGVKSLSVG